MSSPIMWHVWLSVIELSCVTLAAALEWKNVPLATQIMNKTLGLASAKRVRRDKWIMMGLYITGAACNVPTAQIFWIALWLGLAFLSHLHLNKTEAYIKEIKDEQ